MGCFPPFPQPQVGGVSSSSRKKEAFLPQSEAGRAGMWLQELSLGKEKKRKNPPPKKKKIPAEGEGLEQARGEGPIIIFSGFFSKTSKQESLNLDFYPQNE